jgi:hypothetical protein
MLVVGGTPVLCTRFAYKCRDGRRGRSRGGGGRGMGRGGKNGQVIGEQSDVLADNVKHFEECVPGEENSEGYRAEGRASGVLFNTYS